MRRIRRPVLEHSVVHPDGTHERRRRVFCGRLGRSMPLTECTRCPAFLEEIGEEGADARIECSAEGPGPEDEVHAPRSDDPAAELVSQTLLCVNEHVLARAVVRLLEERGMPFILVVDEEGLVIGAIHAVNLQRLVAPTDRARDVMTSPGTAGEATSVRAALLEMAASHRRHIPIVSHDGVPVGVVRDVDALHAWSIKKPR
jgi:CBS domain-containing protein